VADQFHDEPERQFLIRSLRQQLESLARAGLDRVPADRRPAAVQPAQGRPGDDPNPTPVVPITNPRGEGGPDLKSDHAAGHVAKPGPPVELSVLVQPSVEPATPDPPILQAPSLAVLFKSATFESPPVPGGDRPALLAALAAEVAVCRRCLNLAETRTQTVFGIGNPETRLMFIGEAPGFDEDRTGEPFVGRAGQLLTDMITKGMGLAREQVYIANILKCRPPENRNPTPEEASNCFPYLERQIEIIRPEFICLLGRVAAQGILNTTQAMAKLRGRWHRYRGIPTLATYHPSYLLRTPSAKKDAWEDLQILMKEMGLVRPQTKL
jgi:uracil-DNA glycosylase family 4